MSTSSALVCGFGDLAAGIGGLAWDLGEPEAVLLSGDEVKPGSFALEEGGEAISVAITGEDGSIEADLVIQATGEVDAGGEAPARVLSMSCTAEVRHPGAAQTTRCAGQLLRWNGDLGAVATFRHLWVDAGAESLLAATAWGSPNAAGHGEERALGWSFAGREAAAFEETLISTQYDAAANPTRIGLELWPEDADQTSRAAATRVSGSLLGGVGAAGAWAGFFRCHADGSEGLVGYLVRRR